MFNIRKNIGFNKKRLKFILKYFVVIIIIKQIKIDLFLDYFVIKLIWINEI